MGNRIVKATFAGLDRTEREVHAGGNTAPGKLGCGGKCKLTLKAITSQFYQQPVPLLLETLPGMSAPVCGRDSEGRWQLHLDGYTVVSVGVPHSFMNMGNHV